jgi:hypothetical protein
MVTKAATKAASRLLVVAIAAAFAGHGVLASAEAEPVAVGSSVRVFGGDREHVRLVRWAATRFVTRGLGVPAVDVHFHPDTSGCYGHLGSELGGRVDVCVVIVSEIARETLLHEMGHAWIDQNVAQTVRERFTEMRGLRAWNQSTVPWDDRAYEHGAEIIAWGLGNRYMAPSIPDRDPARLAAGFEFLTGVPFPNPSDI